jgi:tripartite-type tricarboxylate transporter receptor subunit TctC
VNYNENGFTVIAGLNVRGSILALKKGSAIHSVNDLIRIAKEKPGSVTVGIPGGGNKQQAVDLMKTLGVELTIVNAGNGNDLFTQVLGGHIEMGLIGAQFYQRFIDEGCEIIAQTVEVREDGVKSVPTLSELGYRMVADNRMFLGGPAGLPDTVVQTLSDAVKKLFADPVFVDGMRKMGETPKYMDTAELAAYHAQYYKTEIPKLKAAKGAAK